jgi:integrase/recombinase XerD
MMVLHRRLSMMIDELNRFLHYLGVEKGLSRGTTDAYRLDLEKGFIPFLYRRGKYLVAEVTRDDIRDYLDYTATSRNNSSITRARKLAAIKSFFKYLVENEDLEINPSASIRSPKIPWKEPQYLTEQECSRFLLAIAQNASRKVRKRDIAIAVLFLNDGLRVSELAKLKMSDVDLVNSQIKITRKGNKEQYLPLNRETVRVLRNYLSSRPPSANGWLFMDKKGDNDLSRRYIYGIIRKYLEVAGIDKGKLGPHILRHTFCTRLHQKGVAPFTIQNLAGHKSLNTTMRYIKIEDREQAEAVSRLEFGMSFRKKREVLVG